ncbi:MAG: hypothetical protein LBM02_08715 [Lachnospiraceae bacterium]|jgi:serine/threonine protein kinase|nr:hypothetical protein [Lachnospiraceae bacterium]
MEQMRTLSVFCVSKKGDESTLIPKKVKGISLKDYLHNRELEYSLVISWLKEIANIMEVYYVYYGNKPYGLINPSQIIVDKAGHIYLPYGNSSINLYGDNSIFYPPKGWISQCDNAQIDIFSFGKLIQYIMKFGKLKSKIFIGNERVLLDLVKRSLAPLEKRAIREFDEIQKKLKRLKGKINNKSKKALIVAASLVVMMGIGEFAIEKVDISRGDKEIVLELNLRG